MNNNTRINKYAVALAASTALISSSSAASILWGTFNNDPSADTEVSTNGTLVEALNLVSADGAVAGATTTVNGVTFTGTNLFGNTYGFTTGVSTGATGLDSLYANFSFNGGDITLGGLNSGDQYEIQVFFGDNRNGVTAARQMAVGTAQPTFDATSSENGADGTWVIGTFTADAGTQTFHSAFSGSSTTEVNAYQLRNVTVPEPSSTALLGLGGLALILRRRK